MGESSYFEFSLPSLEVAQIMPDHTTDVSAFSGRYPHQGARFSVGIPLPGRLMKRSRRAVRQRIESVPDVERRQYYARLLNGSRAPHPVRSSWVVFRLAELVNVSLVKTSKARILCLELAFLYHFLPVEWADGVQKAVEAV